MARPGGGGGSGSTLFTSSIIGPPPGNATTGADQWINLGIIPNGQRFWFGAAQYTSPDKSITFELRTNLPGQSAATLTATQLLSSASATPKSGTLKVDLYKGGTLHIVSSYGMGSEKIWLRLKSKTSTAGSYLYALYYTLE